MPTPLTAQSSISSADLTIAVESSTWNNIGDAFYQNSLIHQFRKHFPAYDVVSMDGPVQRAFRPGKHIGRAYDSRPRVDAAHYVFSGPILGATFVDHYGPLIKDLVARGRSYSLMSVHCNAEGEALERNKRLLRAHPPVAIHTRDHLTFEKLKGIAPCEMDGICFAFFVSEIPHLPILDQKEPYICASYYRGWEPAFAGVASSATELQTSGVRLEWHKQLDQKKWRFARMFEYRRPSADKLGPWTIIRPVQAFSPLPRLTFSKANSFISYNPNNFLAIYKYCQGTLTDRVHAGVATLSFGKAAKVERVDTRFTLFDRVPVKDVNGFMTLEPGALDPLYAEVSTWLSGPFAEAAKLVS